MTTPPSPPEPPIPDLLDLEPSVRVDLSALGQTLVFAFATSGEIGAFDEALERTLLPRSSWDRAHFARDLFLDDLIERCLPIRIGARSFTPNAAMLARIISEPPSDPALIAFRHGVLEELTTSKEHRGDLERIYTEIVELRTLLCAARLVNQTHRRIEILRAVHKVIGSLANAFSTAKSGLHRLHAFGSAVKESPAYQRLDALLDYEQHMGTLDLRVRVGADGELRTFQIVAVRENQKNPFYSSPLGRIFGKILLYLRGYRVGGDEVKENILDNVFSGLERTIVLLFQLLGDIEFYLAGLGLRDMAVEKGLAVCFPRFGASDDKGLPQAGLELRGLFNPLLLDARKVPIPCDIATSSASSVVIVTGPNSGGKTRLLQGVAIAQMLGQSGLFVPAREARMPRFSGLFVSLIEESRSDQPEGQLGMELLRIRRIFEELHFGSLVLIDELCSGTSPSEGEEIARMVISLLPELESQVFITTHLLQFADRLSKEGSPTPLEFLQVELDEHERPTYAFVSGVARTSLAHKTAARLGVTRDELLSLIAEKKRLAAATAELRETTEPHAAQIVEAAVGAMST